MLDAIRRRASSWLVKAFLGLLVLSFAIWGIGDIFLGPRGGSVVATVADLEITAPEVAREFEDELRRYREQLGTAIDRSHPLAAAALNDAVQRLVALRLLDALAEDLGLGASDDEVAARIHADPAFASPTGFDPQRLEVFLRAIGMSERAYVEDVRRQISRERIIATFRDLPAVPPFLTRFLHDRRNERRLLDVLFVDAAAMQVEAPDDATLAAYLESNRDRFIRPEYRRLVLTVLGIDDIVAEIAVDEAELRQLYQERKERYRVPERRHIVQLLAPDEETAKLVHSRLAAGEMPEALAQDLAARGVRFADLGRTTRDALPAAIADAAFALAEGTISAPVPSAFGWHVLIVRAIEPEHVPSFEEKRDELETELKRQRAAQQLPALATAFDDELAAGTPIEEAAARFGANVYSVTIDRSGRGPDGKPALPEILSPEMLAQMFAAREGEASLLTETSDGRYYVFRVDAIEPQRPLELADARERIIAAWQIEQQRRAAKSLAETLLKRLQAGEPLEVVAATPGVRHELVGPLRRSDAALAKGLAAAVLEAAFARAEGELLADVFEGPTAAAVVRVAKIEPAPEPTAEQLAAIERELRDAYEGDLLAQLEAALRHRYPVHIDERAMAAFLNG
jgi:peptidyl-prolyl cis-trans isomerase D